MSDYSELKKLAAAATPGPWSHSDPYVCPSRAEDGTTYVELWRSIADCRQPVNARFMAAANPAAVMAMIDELESYQMSASHQVVKGIVEAAVGDTVNMLLGAVKASEACGGPVWIITATQDGVMRKRVISPFEWSEDSRSMYEWAEGMEISQTKIFPDAAEVSQ